eukprot:TRINITY_DN26941_c0_g1_i1.p1 TRINITY_DN26941_c0_g1~~TRINITY_DN26941_c0_g1_i1.p1  ORF type:complete len:288 (+),score=49.96 TRINITY_DN26941_c0_g1_i1:129-992(+)
MGASASSVEGGVGSKAHCLGASSSACVSCRDDTDADEERDDEAGDSYAVPDHSTAGIRGSSIDPASARVFAPYAVNPLNELHPSGTNDSRLAAAWMPMGGPQGVFGQHTGQPAMLLQPETSPQGVQWRLAPETPSPFQGGGFLLADPRFFAGVHKVRDAPDPIDTKSEEADDSGNHHVLHSARRGTSFSSEVSTTPSAAMSELSEDRGCGVLKFLFEERSLDTESEEHLKDSIKVVEDEETDEDSADPSKSSSLTAQTSRRGRSKAGESFMGTCCGCKRITDPCCRR